MKHYLSIDPRYYIILIGGFLLFSLGLIIFINEVGRIKQAKQDIVDWGIKRGSKDNLSTTAKILAYITETMELNKGRNIELRKYGNYVQWRFIGDINWNDLNKIK